MKFFSGFSLKNEQDFFKEFSDKSEYTISGFSYGAIKAFEYVKEELKKGNRIDRLQLYSPAFFQTKSSKFKRVQTIAFSKDKGLYIENFLKSCFMPHSVKSVEKKVGTLEELKQLLEFEWSLPDILELHNKGVKIEVYLGSEDIVIDALGAREFFLQVSTVTYIKNANHFLQLN